MLLGGVVDQHVQPAEALQVGAHRMAAKVGIADVAADQQAALAFLLHQPPGGVGIVVLL